MRGGGRLQRVKRYMLPNGTEEIHAKVSGADVHLLCVNQCSLFERHRNNAEVIAEPIAPESAPPSGLGSRWSPAVQDHRDGDV